MRSNASLHLSEPRAARVEIDEGLLVEVRPPRHDDSVEDSRVLPGLTAMGDGVMPCSLKCFEKCDKLVPGFGLRRRLIEHRLVGPDPVGRVHVDRSGDPVAVIFGESC
jgi:hypothetical protein